MKTPRAPCTRCTPSPPALEEPCRRPASSSCAAPPGPVYMCRYVCILCTCDSVCMYMYTCMYSTQYTDTSTHLQCVHVYVYIHLQCTCICIHTRAAYCGISCSAAPPGPVHMYIFTLQSVHVYICTYVHRDLWDCTQVQIYELWKYVHKVTYTCTYTCTCTCTCTCTYTTHF